MKISSPGMGAYTKLIVELANYLGWDFIPPPPPTERSIELGTTCLAAELICLPAKVTLGSMIEACEQGATDLIMFDSCGTCRMKTYWILQQRALRKLGYKATVHPIRLGIHTARDLQRVGPTVPYWKVCKVLVKLLLGINELDKKLWTETPQGDNHQVKIGIIGEIYSVLEPAVNKNLFRKLEKLGAVVHNSLPLTYFIFKRLYNWGWLKRRGIDRQTYLIAEKEAHKLLPKEVGGHGNESIIHTLYYAMRHFDGVVHVLPFPCMPESTVAPVLDDISRDYKIPVMRFVFDTHTGEAGMDTRLEAFIDILKRKKAAHPPTLSQTVL